MKALDDLAEAVAAELNTAGLADDFACAVDWLPEIDRPQLDEAGQLVYVTPENWRTEPGDRLRDAQLCGITVSIWRPPGDDIGATVKACAALADAIYRHLRNCGPLLNKTATWAGAEAETPVDADTLAGMRVVSAALTVFYRVYVLDLQTAPAP